MTESAGIETWIYEQLSGDAAVATLVSDRIYSYLAPQTAEMPFVVFAPQGASVVVSDARRGRPVHQSLYVIKAVGSGSGRGSLYAIEESIRAVLLSEPQALVEGAVQLLSCWREQGIDYVEVVEGKRYDHVGSVYRIMAYRV